MHDSRVSAQRGPQPLERHILAPILRRELQRRNGNLIRAEERAAREVLRAQLLWNLQVRARRDEFAVLQQALDLYVGEDGILD